MDGSLDPSRIAPRLLRTLAEADDLTLVDVVVQLKVPRFRPAPLPPTTTTFAIGAPSGGVEAYTLNGAPSTRSQMLEHARHAKASINQALLEQVQQRRSVVEAAIADVEASDVSRSDGGFRVSLPRAQVRTLLARLGSRLRYAMLPPRIRPHLTAAINGAGVGALDKIGVAPFAHDYGMRGAGVGIWHSEGYAPYKYRPELGTADIRYLSNTPYQPIVSGLCFGDKDCCSGKCSYFQCQPPSTTGVCNAPCHWKYSRITGKTCVGDDRGFEHATLVALALNKTAPDATIYHAVADGGVNLTNCMIYSDIVKPRYPEVFVGSQSWSIEGDGATDWSYNVIGDNGGVCNSEWDDFIVSSRIAHFHSSGNENDNYIGSPARAYNVTAVGNYDHVADLMTAESGFRNPDTGVEKPEIVAPGTSVAVAAGFARTGSSISAPVAAGFAADMIGGSPFFRNQPQAVRAYLIAGAHNVHSGAGFGSSYDLPGKHDGAGRLDYLDTYYNRWGKVWAHGSNSSFFVNDEIVEHVTLTAGKRYSVAIAWLADGAYAFKHKTLNMRMQLTLSQGAYHYTEYRPYNNFQRLDLVAPNGGIWKITIKRWNNSGQGGVDLALTVGEVGGTWTCAPTLYNDNTTCHCGCGITDPDCAGREVGDCDVTAAAGSCAAGGSAVCACNNARCGGSCGSVGCDPY